MARDDQSPWDRIAATILAVTHLHRHPASWQGRR